MFLSLSSIPIESGSVSLIFSEISAINLYRAPLSRIFHPSFAANNLATVPFPEPPGPSIVIKLSIFETESQRFCLIDEFWKRSIDTLEISDC